MPSVRPEPTANPRARPDPTHRCSQTGSARPASDQTDFRSTVHMNQYLWKSRFIFVCTAATSFARISVRFDSQVHSAWSLELCLRPGPNFYFVRSRNYSSFPTLSPSNQPVVDCNPYVNSYCILIVFVCIYRLLGFGGSKDELMKQRLF